MRLVLTGRQIEISPGLRALVDRKLQRLDRTFGDAIVSAQVVCGRQPGRLQADVTVHMRGDHILAGKANGPTWQSVLTRVMDKIARQGQTVKGKWKERKRRTVPPAAGRRTPAAGPPTPQAGARVVRVTRTALKPMTVENAAAELLASGEPHLVFRNAETDRLSVLLRRGPGEVGLVEPGR